MSPSSASYCNAVCGGAKIALEIESKDAIILIYTKFAFEWDTGIPRE
jgi:hypothetical protein